MVAMVSGSGLGLFGSSISGLGGIGNAGVGRGTDRVFLNSTTGNLVIQSQDDRLAALGLDLSLVRTYNSQGLLDDDNGDNWRLGVHQRVYELTGTLNTSGSTVRKVFGDGRDVLYTYDASQGRYVSTEGDGAHDTLTNSGGTWTWTDGSGRNTETYNSAGQLTHSRDADGNTVEYRYIDGLLREIEDASGQITHLDYDGNNLTQIRVVSNGQTQTLTRYFYDEWNRLQQVVLDLSPADNAVSLSDANGDGLFDSVNDQVYVTTYTYDGASTRITSITQGDGSSVAFSYEWIDGEYRVASYTDALGRATTINYYQPSSNSGIPAHANANESALTHTRTDRYDLDPAALSNVPGSWQITVPFETASADANQPHLRFDRYGNGVAVWRQGNDIMARQYTASTASWSSPVTIHAGNDGQTNLVLAVDRDSGDAIVAWLENDGTAVSVHASRFNANTGSWSATRLVENAAGAIDGFEPLSVSIAGGHVAVGWVQHDGVADSLYWSTLVAGSWTTPTVVDVTEANAMQPEVAIDAAGNAMLVWRQQDTSSGEPRIFARYWQHTAQAFGNIVNLGADRLPSLQFDGEGNAFAVWGGGAQVRRFDAATGHWGALIQLTNSGISGAPRLAVDATGNALVAWVDHDGTTSGIYASRYDVGTDQWSTAARLDSANGEIQGETSFAVGLSGGEAVVAWTQIDSTSASDVYASRLSGGVWSSATLLDTRSETASQLTVAIDAGGNATVLWMQPDESSRSLYQAQFVAPNYIVPAGATWQSIANALYGVNSVAAGQALRAALGGVSLAAGVHLSGFPDALDVETAITPYYTVQAGDTWAHITQRIYGTSDTNAIAQLQSQLGNPTLTTGLTLAVPTSLAYVTSGSSQAAVNWRELANTITQHHPLNDSALTRPPGSWSSAVLLEESDTPVSSLKIAADRNGNAIAVWAQGSDVLVRRFDALSGAWSAATVLDASAYGALEPQLVVDADSGDALVAWVQSDSNALSLYARRFDAATGTWEPTQLLENAAGSVNQWPGGVSMSMANGRAAIAWMQHDGVRESVYLSRFESGAWTAPTLLEVTDEAAMYPKASIDSNGNILVLWRQYSAASGEYRVHSVRWDATTQSYGATQMLDSDGDRNPRVEFDAAGNAFAVWSSGPQVRRFDVTTGTWSTQISLQAGAGESWGGELAVDSNGNALVAWVQSDGTARSVYARQYDVTTGTWGAATLVESGSNPVSVDHDLSLAFEGGAGVVAWMQVNGSDVDLYASRFSAGAWGAATLLESESASPSQVVTAIDGSGNPWVTWLQSNGTASSAYLSHFERTPYYTVPSGATWQSIANALYGVDSIAAGEALQAALGSPALTTGLELRHLPSTLSVTTTASPYYAVQSGDTWEGITQRLFGTSAAEAVTALRTALGQPTLVPGLQLTVPALLNYSGSGASGYLQTDVQDALGQITTYLQDSAGRLTTILSPAVNDTRLETQYAYDADGNVTSITQDPTGLNRVTTFEYDANGNVVLTRDSLGNTVTRTYDSNNQLLTETRYLVPDPDGAGSAQPSEPKTTRYVYDGESHLRFVISPEGRVTERQYDAAGQLTSTRTYTAATYAGAGVDESDLAAWTGTVDRSHLEIEFYAYDFRGNVSSITRYIETDSNGAPLGTPIITRLVYDQRGQLLQTIDPRGEATTSDANDYLTAYTYDGLGRVLTTSEWISANTTRTTLNTYDDVGRITRTTLASGLVTTRTYNRAGELISLTNGTAAAQASLGTTTYVYDALGRLRMQTGLTDANNPTGVSQFYVYDAAGRQVAHIDGDGSLTEFVYNNAGQRIEAIQYADGLSEASRAALIAGSVSLDTLRNDASDDAANDRITRNVYDASGALVFTIDPTGAVIEHRYDGAGRLTETIQYANRITVDRNVGELQPDDVTALEHNDDRRTRYFYDGDGLKLGELDGEGYLTEFGYNGAGRLVVATRYANRSAVDQRRTGTFADLLDSVGTDNEAIEDPEQDQVTHYYYDALGRQSGILDAAGFLTEIRYDAANNVSQRIRYDEEFAYQPTLAQLTADITGETKRETTTYTYDGDNKLVSEVFTRGTSTEFSSLTTLYSFDDVGNLVSTTRAAGTDEARTTRTRYDFLGRVTQELTAEGAAQLAALSNPTQAQIDDIWDRYGSTYAYDLGGRRISATVRPNDSQTNTTLYFYDEDNRLRFEVNALGERKEYQYNALGQVTDEITYFNRISTSGLSGGQLNASLIATLTAHADSARDGHIVKAYTLGGQIASILSAEGASTSFIYNAFEQEESRSQQLTSTVPSNLLQVNTYDRMGRLLGTRRDPSLLNQTELRSYDGFGRLTTITDANGNVREFQYDRLGRTILTIDGVGARRGTAYDAFDRVLKTIDAFENETTYSYNDSTRTVVVTTPQNIAVTTAYNHHGQTLEVTAAGNTTRYEYDANGALIAVSDNLSDEPLEERGYDRAGRQITTTDANGNVTTLGYDAVNRVLTRTTTVGGVALTTAYEYDGAGRVFRVTEPNGTQTVTTYDREGRVTEVVVDPDGLNIRTVYAYDLASRLIRVTNAAGDASQRVTEYTYDVLGRRTLEVVDPGSGINPATGREYLNLTTAYRYDDNDNLTRKIDGKGNSTWYVYDGNDRLTHTIDALGGVTRTTYDVAGRATVTERFATKLSDDFMLTLSGLDVVGAGQLNITMSEFDRRTQRFYDLDGREIYTVDAGGGVTERIFDDNGNVTRQRIFARPVAAQLYTTIAQLRTAIGAAGNSLETLASDDRVSWTAYDLRGRAEFTVDGTGAVTLSEYDTKGNVVATTAFVTLLSGTDATDHALMVDWANAHAGDAGNRVTRYWYDALDRLRFSQDAEGYLTEVRYEDVANREIRLVYEAPLAALSDATLAHVVDVASSLESSNAYQSTTTQFDAAGRELRITDTLGFYEEFEYDDAGNKTRFRNKAGAVWNYEYDANGRLIYERSPSVEITRLSASGNSLAIDTINSGSVSVVTYLEYDALGNVTARTEAYGTPESRTTSYEYDELGRQIKTIFPMARIYNPAAGDTIFGNGSAIVPTLQDWAMWSEVSYDTLGNAFRSRDVAGNHSYKTYDRLGRVEYEIDAENYVTRREYDTFGNEWKLTRYAEPLTEGWFTGGNSLSSATVAALIDPQTSQDRTLVKQYDRLNRLVLQTTEPPVFNFSPNAGAPDGTTFLAGQRTVHEYNAFGQLVRSRELIGPQADQYADTYFYYDRRGLKTAEVDALGYVTEYEYDETGDLTRQVEYARALATMPTLQGYGAAPITTPATHPNGNPQGYDRETRYEYDALNRKISETKVAFEHAVLVNGVPQTTFADQVTTFGYDAVGNQTRVSQLGVLVSGTPTDLHRYTYYDALGRAIGTAEPATALGDGNTLVPLTYMYRDALGNLVGETRFANGANGVATESSRPTPAAVDSARDRTTLLLLDSYGRATHTQDATGAARFASYDARGQMAKEWQPVSNSGVTEYLTAIYRYDRLGRQTHIIEAKRYDGSNTQTVTRASDYNAFGEMISRGIIDNAGGDGTQEFFEYDQAGRLWRTNSEDGVTKVFLHDLAGNVTAEIRSRELNLRNSANAAAVEALSGGVIRTELRYDALGRVVEQRLPTFEAGSGMDSIGATFTIGNVNGPANPFAIYQMIDFGWGPFYVLNPAATLAEGGGYYLTSDGQYVLDPNHQIISAVRITWDAPADERVQATLEYRPLGSTDPNAWSSVIVGRLPNDKLGADVSSLVNQTYEYRVSYRRRAETNAYAEATGTFRVDGTASGLINITQNTSDLGSEISMLSPNYSDGIITWAAPGDSTVVATFRVRRQFTDTYTDITATRSGGNFRVDVRAALGMEANYDYEIVYTRDGEIIARRTGSLHSTGTSTPRIVSSTITNSPMTIFTYPIEPLSGAAGASVSSIIQSREQPRIRNWLEDHESQTEYYWSGTNVVNLSWGDLGSSGRVKVRLEYISDSHEINGEEAKNLEQIFASAPTGANVSWSTDTRRREPFAGGINSVTRVVVYTETAPNSNVWVPRYDQPSPPPSLGKSISWDIEADAELTPSFEIRVPGGQYASVPVTLSGLRWTVDLSAFSDAAYEYRVQYRDGGRLVSEQTGNVTLSSGSTNYTTTTTVTADPPRAIPTVGSISALPGVTTTIGTFSSAEPFYRQYQGRDEVRWWGTNSVTVNYSELGTTSVRIVVDYTTLPGDGVPQSRTYPATGTAAATSATATSATLSWNGSTPFEAWELSPGGIGSVQRIRVYAADGVTLLRDSAVPPSPPTLAWPAPGGGVNALFAYRPSGSSGDWTYVTPGSNGSQLLVGVGGLSGAYEYWIGYQRPGDSYHGTGATGTFSVSGQSVTLNSQTAFNNAPTWIHGVTHSGSNVTWTQAPDDNTQVVFQYWNGSAWITRGHSVSNGAYSVDMTGLPAGSHAYRITYTRNGESIPYREASGTFNVAVSTHVEPPYVAIAMQANLTFPMVNFTGVTIDGETLSWSYPIEAGSDTTVRVTYTYGSNLHFETVATGSGPNFQVAIPAPPSYVQPLSLGYTISYYRQGETTAYARSSGQGFVGVSYPTIYPTVTIQSQEDAFPSGVTTIPAPQDLGGNIISWGPPAEASANIRLRYRHATGGNWTELDWDPRPDGTGYQADLAAVADGNYVYEISYTRPGEPNPYALGRGSLEVDRITTATNITITPNSPTNPSREQYTPTQTQSFDRWGNVIASTDAANNTTDYRFNALNQLTQIIAPLTRVVSTKGGQIVESDERPVSYNYYDNAGRLIGTRDANGNVNQTELNAAGQVIRQIHADGEDKTFAYNAFGENVSITDELGYVTRNEYDRGGRLISVGREVALNGFNTPDPNDVIYDTFAYDEANRRISQTNGENETTRHYYDLHGNLIRTRTHLGAETDYEYDAQGRKTREEDAIDGYRTWQYDYFGRATGHRDLGGILYNYTHDLAGLLTAQTSGAGNRQWQNQEFWYDDAGHLIEINDIAIGRVTTYGYNSAGQRSHEKTVINGLVHQDTYIEYDELGRTRGLSDLRYDLTYSYDAHGNRTQIAATYYDHQLQLEVQDLWYTYDSMNRVLISQGVDVFGQVGIDAIQGVRMTYDEAGRRKTAETTSSDKIIYEDIAVRGGSGEWSSTPDFFYAAGSTTERYFYDGIGRLTKMERSGESRVSSHGEAVRVSTRWDALLERTYDKASRAIGEINRAVENNDLVTRSSVSYYNDDGQLTRQETDKLNIFTGWHDESIVDYTVDAANVVRGYTVQVFNGNSSYTSTYTNHYVTGETYLDSGQFVSSTGDNAPQSGSTLRNYNVNRELIKFSDNRDPSRTRHFANNANGQALTVVQGDISDPTPAFDAALDRTNNSNKAQHFFTANGQAIGSFGQLQDASGKFKANFDVNYTAISDSYPSSVPMSVVAQAGDTLRLLAARILGDGNLWYVLAEENGLTDPNADIPEGTVIRVPNEVISLSNNSTSFKPFDASSAIGDTTPTQPMPPPRKGGCGVLGMIIVIVVAIVVTYITAGAAASAIGTAGVSGGATVAGVGGLTTAQAVAAAAIGAAAGSVASQGVAIAIGMQDSFSWTSLAASVLTAGTLQGSGVASMFGSNPSFAQHALQGAISSSVNQGVNIALGLQDSFSWREVAISGLSSALSAEVAQRTGGTTTWTRVRANVSSSLTSAMVRRSLGGRMDSDAVLADVFGNALGNSIVDGMAPRSAGELTPHERRMRGEDGNRRPTRSAYQSAALPEPVIESPLDNNPDLFANLSMPSMELSDELIFQESALAEARYDVERSVVFDLLAQEERDALLSPDFLLTGGGTNALRVGSGRAPIRPVMNENWDNALNLASDPFGILDPIMGAAQAGRELAAARYKGEIESTRSMLKELGIKNVPEGFEQAWVNDKGVARTVPDYSATAKKLATVYEDHLRDQRLRETWGDDYANVRIGKSRMTVTEFENRTLTLQQKAVDQYYDMGVDLIARGELKIQNDDYARTLGSFIDDRVRGQLRAFAKVEGINDSSVSNLWAINRRLSSDLVSGYGIPDVRLGNNLYSDTTLARKYGSTEQIIKWNAIRPASGVVIVRPTQLGGSWAIPPSTIQPYTSPVPRPRR